MYAFQQPAAGEQPVVADLPRPAAAPGTVVVRVKAAALGGTDAGIVAGQLAAMLPHVYPLVVGRDASGVVEAVGAGVDHVEPGDDVVGHIPLVPPVQAGTVAEYAALDASTVAPKPAGVTHVDAAAVPLAGCAAYAAVDAAAVGDRDVVFVSGASGGVGSFAVQLLKARGAHVVATATGADLDRMAALGADEVVDFRVGSVEDAVHGLHPDGVDVLLDLVFLPAGPPLGLVRKGGRAVSLLNAFTDDTLDAAGVSGVNLWAQPSREVISTLLAQVADGTLRVDVQQVVTLDEAPAALAAVARGEARGKTVVELS